MRFIGFSAFPITPTFADGQLDGAAFRKVLDPILAAEVNSIGLLGSTGAYPYLSTDVRKEAVVTALDHIDGAVPAVVGIGAIRTDMSVELAQHAAEAGANGLLMAPMSYQVLSEPEVYDHFAAVAEATNLPLCIYNNPGTTQFRFSVDLIRKLAKIPTITAVKMPLPARENFADELKRLRDATPNGFQIGYSGDWGCAMALLAGADCWHSAVGGILPSQCRALADAVVNGDTAKTAAISQAIAPIWDLTKAHGSYRVSYAIARGIGIADVSPILPVKPLTAEIEQQLVDAVEHLNKVISNG